MKKIISLSIADPGLLKNQHNQLFLKLMDQLEIEKERKAALSKSPGREEAGDALNSEEISSVKSGNVRATF